MTKFFISLVLTIGFRVVAIADTTPTSFWICTYKTKNAGLAFRGTDSSQIAAKRMARNRCLSGSSEGIYNPAWCVFQGCQQH